MLWDFYDRGFSLFPLVPNTKSPAEKWESFQTVRASPAQIENWRRHNWNTGVATGAVSGVIVLDCDSTLARAEAEGRGIPATLTVSTPRGTHFYFRHPGFSVSNKAGRGWTVPLDGVGVDGWDLRADGGYVVGPGSFFRPTAAEIEKGKVEGWYRVEHDAPIAPAPQWLLSLVQPKERKAPAPAKDAESTSRYGQKCLDDEVAAIVATTPGGGECNDRLNASAYAVGQLVGGGEITKDDGWNALWGALETLGIVDDGKSPGTIERGWVAGLANPRAASDASQPINLNEILGTRAMVAAASTPVAGPSGETRVLSLSAGELEDKANHLTIEFWLNAGGYTVAFDEFGDRVLLNGKPLTDHSEREAWLRTRELSHLKFAKDLFSDVVRNIAWANRFHPLRDWLDAVQTTWDGTPRLDRWMTTYLGVEDSEYSRAVGAILLTAAVRRARQPGAKFDEIIVLEGPQGIEKSTAISCLCPDPAWFSDDFNVSMSSRELLETTEGKWIIEAPELSKLNNAEVEQVKHMLSRRVDKARKAYDRTPTERGRQWVAFASVNADRYLTDPTGNRRFWPVRVGSVDLAGIIRDREQIWAEVCQREAAGASIRLDKTLWAVAAEEQAQRVVVDASREILEPLLEPFSHGRIAARDVWSALHIPVDRQQAMGRKVGDVMRNLGWNRTRLRDETGGRPYFYTKGDDGLTIFWDVATQRFITERPKLTAVQ